MSRFIVLSWVLTGCAIDGLYTGECTLESGDNKYIYEVEVDIDQDGEDLGGDALVLYPRDGSYGQGSIEGSKTGDDVQMVLKFDEGGLTDANMNLDGTLDGRDISGGCERGSLFGSFTVTRR